MGAQTGRLLAVALALGAWTAHAGPTLKLRTGAIDVNQLAKIADITTRHGIIQFESAADVDAMALQAMGLDVLHYVPDHAFVVRFNQVTTDQIRKLAGVRYVGPFATDWKTAPGLRERTSKSGQAREQLEITGFRGESAAAIAGIVRKVAPAATIVMERVVGGIPYVRVELPGDRAAQVLDVLAGSDPVAWIDQYVAERELNADSVGVIQNNTASGGLPPTATPVWNRDLIGTGQIVAVADTGVDRNEDYFIRHDNGQGALEEITDAELVQPGELGTLYPERKVVGYWYPPGASPYDDSALCNDDGPRTSYHGTHVASSILGDSGTPSSPSEPNYDVGDGMAPNAQLLVLDLGNDETGCLSGFSSATYADLMRQAAGAGAHIISVSIGASPPPNDEGTPDPSRDGYFFSDFSVDTVSYQLEDMLGIFAAGNDGDLLSSGAVSHPAASKHALAVGATGHGTDPNRADFSSPGPSFDGRIKPDIMAPGTDIRSAAGDDNDQNPLLPFGNAPSQASKSGTSMATPTVSGGTALLRQYFIDGFYPTGRRSAPDSLVPSGALMKAALLNGTSTYADTPSINTGFGRIWLDNSLYFSGDSRGLRLWDVPNEAGLTTGESVEFQIQVAAGQEFRTTLVWRDPPAASYVGATLINDLDLEVIGAGATWRGNNFSSGQSVAGGSADRINPVEQVRIASPQAGTYTIRVTAAQAPGDGSLNSNKQGFALVSSAMQCDSGVSSAPDVTVSSDASGVRLAISDVPAAQSYEVNRSPGSCNDDPQRSRFIGATTGNSYLDDSTTGGFEYAYRVRGADACGTGPVSVCKSVVSNAACALAPIFDPASVVVSRTDETSCSIAVTWDAGEPGCPDATVGYNVYRSVDPLFVPGPANLLAADVGGTSYVDTTAESLKTYYYAVRAVDSLGNELADFTRSAITARASSSSPGEFRDDPDVISLVDLQGIWQVTDARASTGEFSYVNARPGQTYPNLTCARVVTPAIQLQATPGQLSYDARFNLEADWDGVVVEISTDGGATWQDLPPDQGYPGDFKMTESEGTPVNECGYPKEQGAFNGEQVTFQAYTSDLTAYAGQEVLIRWSFSSDPGSEFEGFFLDNIRVANASTPDACTVGTGVKRSGPWFNADEAGHGWFIEHLDGASDAAPDRINAYWYVYREQTPVWLIGQGDLVGSRAELDVLITNGADFPPDFNAENVNLTPWGTLTFEFTSETTGTASWSSLVEGFGAGTLAMQQIAPIAEEPEACLSGSYYNVDQSGHGFVAQVVNVGGELQVLLAWYVYLDGEQVWLLGQAPLVDGRAEIPMGRFTGADFPPNFDPTSVVNQAWGTLTIEFTDSENASIRFDSDLPEFADGEIQVVRLTTLHGHRCQ